VTASANEIKERYRTLSVIFHPDKQHDEQKKDTAAMEFLEIQKAYEGERIVHHAKPKAYRQYIIVLSDPFLR